MNSIKSFLTPERRMQRIQKVCNVFRVILLVCLVIEVAAALAAVIQLVLLHQHHPQAAKSQVKEGDWTFSYSVAGISNYGDLVLLPFVFMVTLSFFQLFSRMKEGHLFEGPTIAHLEKAGKWWMALGLAELAAPILNSIVPPHDLVINLADAGEEILCGLVTFLIAWIFREGQTLKEEQQLTV